MSSEENEAAAHPKEFTIIVDTVPRTVDDETVSWKQVVEIAYLGQSEDPAYVFKVQYEDAKSKPHAGALVKGQSVEVKKDGTTFSVLRSVVS